MKKLRISNFSVKSFRTTLDANEAQDPLVAMQFESNTNPCGSACVTLGCQCTN